MLSREREAAATRQGAIPDAGRVDVSISLVALNQRRDLERLLPTLVPAAIKVSAEILLVDNRSTDATADLLRTAWPSVDVLRNPEVAGYGANHNLNLRRANGRYFVVMNSDMTIEERTFVVLKQYMDRHPDVGVVTPRIVNEDGTIQGLNKRYPTLWDLFLRRFLPAVAQPLFRGRLDRYEMRDVGYERECDVPFVSGAFMFCRTEVVRALDGFDERYFLYFEDADLCRRVQQSHRTTFCPDATVTHCWHRSAHTTGAGMREFIRSGRLYFERWGWRLF